MAAFSTFQIVDGTGAFQNALFFTSTGAQLSAASMPVVVASDSPGPNWPASGVSIVSGSFSATGQSAAFIPQAGRPFNIELWTNASSSPGISLSAIVYLARQTPGSPSILLPITANGLQIMSFATVASDQWQEEAYGVSYYLVCSSYYSGTVNYKLSQ